MKQGLILYLVLVLTFISNIYSQGAGSCRSSTNCHECIGKAQCAWCSKEDFTSSRCDSQENLRKLGCPPNNVSNPISKSTNEENKDVGATVQVQPQRIRLDLRSGQTTTVKLTVRPAENYPVDLYYLMDMSYSMKNDLEKLTTLASKIAASMRNITTNFKLGFGSFVDKTVSPYVRTETKVPCLSADSSTVCVPTYGFRHILPLVAKPVEFQNKVKEQVISGNLDAPEGGFDALMQVAVCEKDIGWSVNGTSRRLVIFVTDAPFHVAGDGKLGGIVTPNDGKCHLKDFNGKYMLYSKSNELDYPSLAQLHDKLQQSNVLPIFAVIKEVSSLYQGVTSLWSDLGAVTGELADDSGNVVDLIERKYKEIVSSVSLVYNTPAKVSVTVKANCGANAVSDQTQKCSNVKIGEKVTFDVSVTLEQCPQEQADYQKSFTIRVPGFGAVVMDLNYICQCECEKPSMAEENSTKCSDGNGTFACGQCVCNKGRYGEFCQCDTPFDKLKDQSKCKSSPNATDEVLCSGNGECACGKCVCKAEQGKRFYGDLCQCNDFSCPEDKGQLCGGPDRGVCLCRKCQCKPKYHGDNCDKKNCTFFPPETQCKKDADSEICGGSDRGTCEPDVENCHKCVCKSAYDGTYCEKCPNCEDGMCSRNEKCALCSTFEGKSLEECKESGICEANVLEVQVVDDIKTKTDEGLYRCEGVVDGCTYYFTTQTEENSERFVLFVQKEKVSCPEEAPIMWIVVGVVGGILLLGLVILALIKAFFTMVDRIEYQKFERERMHSRWTKEKNPLYQAAKTTFENPTYAGGRQ